MPEDLWLCPICNQNVYEVGDVLDHDFGSDWAEAKCVCDEHGVFVLKFTLVLEDVIRYD